MTNNKDKAKKSTSDGPLIIGDENHPLVIVSSDDDSSHSSDDELQARARAWLKLNGPGESSRARETKLARPWLHGPACINGCRYPQKCGTEESPIGPECGKGCMHHKDCIDLEVEKEAERMKSGPPNDPGYLGIDPYLVVRHHLPVYWQNNFPGGEEDLAEPPAPMADEVPEDLEDEDEDSEEEAEAEPVSEEDPESDITDVDEDRASD